MSFIDQIAASNRNGSLPFAEDASGSRSGAIARTGAVGICVNVVLAAVKFVLGIVTNSIAITSDAVNNLADALSSLITIVGMKLSGKRADRPHPYGYGRIEYLTTLIIGAMILASGISMLFEAVEHIVKPEEASYTPVLLALLGGAIAVKLVLGMYFKRRGRLLESDTLVATGQEALLDTLVTLATIVAALISILWGVTVEPYFAAAISLLIIKTGVEVFIGAGSKMLGKRPDAALARKVREAADRIEGVGRSCNLRLVDYGPQAMHGSIYIEVDERLAARDVDRLAQAVQLAVYMDCQVLLDAVGVYPVDRTDPEVQAMRDHVEKIARAHEGVLDIYGFRVRREADTVLFDVSVDFEVADREQLCDQIAAEATRAYPDYQFIVTSESSMAD